MNCPSCNAEPEETKCNGVRYHHLDFCKVGSVREYSHRGCMGNYPKHAYQCNKCKAWFDCKNNANPGDSTTLECPLCWARESDGLSID